jgi:cell division protein FtsZ
VADPEANVIYGIVTDESMGDAVKVTVIATGFTPRQAQGAATPVDLVNYVGPGAQSACAGPGRGGRLLPQDAQCQGRGGRRRRRIDLDVPAFLRKQGGGEGSSALS